MTPAVGTGIVLWTPLRVFEQWVRHNGPLSVFQTSQSPEFRQANPHFILISVKGGPENNPHRTGALLSTLPGAAIFRPSAADKPATVTKGGRTEMTIAEFALMA